jgi:hypothetical protein
MRKSFAFLAVVVFAGLATDAASAATYSAGYCRGKLESNIRGCYKTFHGDTASGCATAAYNRFAGCMSAGTGTKAQRLQRSNLKPAQASGSGITNVQTVPLNQTGPQYVRPGPNGNPCTVHCGPQGGRKGK